MLPPDCYPSMNARYMESLEDASATGGNMTKHIYSLELPQDIFDKCTERQDITKKFIDMVKKIK